MSAATYKYDVDAQTKRETYKIDQATNKPIVSAHGYAKDENGLPYYPRDGNNEFMDPTLGLIERNGRIVYPTKAADGRPNYLKDTTVPAKEVYSKYNGKWIIGTGTDGHQYYAKDENDDEYYPADNTFARKANGTPYYANKAAGETIFPKDSSGNELYITPVDPLKAYTIPTKYAKAGTDEIYPKTIVPGNLESDYILMDRYAKKGTTAYYPLDEYNNEFYISSVTKTNAVRPDDELVLTEYAKTNDGKIILPTKNNTHYIIAGKAPAVLDTNVMGKLVRVGRGVSSDWLTDVEATTKPKVPAKAYIYYNTSTGVQKTVKPPGAAPLPKVVAAGASATGTVSFYKTWYFWIALVITLIVKSFAIWWFVFRNKTGYRIS